MNSIPTGGPATPSCAGDDPAAAEDDDAADVPAPRSGAQPLPRRSRGRHRAVVRRPAAADEATLDRLLAGLREI